jgi:predicted RNA binding protein YcfA (HicA-like mRNA interferase family)
MNNYYPLVVQKLREHGYTFLRAGKGSHEAWGNGVRTQIVTRNLSSRHLANDIMKQAAIAHRF